MTELVTLTRDQLDEYTRRVVEATYDDLRGEKLRARRAAAQRRRQEGKRDLVLSRLPAYDYAVLRYVHVELMGVRLTAREIIRRADARQERADRRRAAQYERMQEESRAAALRGDVLAAFVAAAPPLPESFVDKIRGVSSSAERESVRATLDELLDYLR